VGLARRALLQACLFFFHVIGGVSIVSSTIAGYLVLSIMLITWMVERHLNLAIRLLCSFDALTIYLSSSATAFTLASLFPAISPIFVPAVRMHACTLP